jgi:RimJ/RimL family protein N-acetyltransferase
MLQSVREHAGRQEAVEDPTGMPLLHHDPSPAFGPRVRVSAAQRTGSDPPPGASDASAGPASPPVPEETIVTRGKHIYLRTFTRDDLRYLDDWCEDPELDRLVGSEFLQLYRAYEKDPSFYDAVLNDPTQIVLMIVPNREPRTPIGLVRLMNIHQAEGYAGIETIVADPRALRRGYGVMASRLMAFYGVDTIGLRRLEAKAYEYNPLSINTLKRNGFTQEGVLRQAAYRDGRYWDIIVFGILRDEIEEQRRKDRYLLPPEDVQAERRDPS